MHNQKYPIAFLSWRFT